MKSYKYDIAISLCKEDVGFARKLIRELNPKLEVFFYEDKQEELISKLGPEKFANIFKQEARVVVILYRDAWGDSFYTELEKSAIIDRTGKKDEGQGFIFLIPLEKGKSPSWYPSSRIYANPFNFAVEQLAHFIEFKVVERDGEITPLTFKEKIEYFKQRLKGKSARRNYLLTKESLTSCKDEIEQLVQAFNSTVDIVPSQQLPFPVGLNKIPDSIAPHFNVKGSLSLGDFYLQLEMQNDKDSYHRNMVCSQNYTICLSIIQTYESEGKTGSKIVKKASYRYNTDMELHHGWSIVSVFKDVRDQSFALFLLFDHPQGYHYDLQEIIDSGHLIDSWFKELQDYAEQKYHQILL